MKRLAQKDGLFFLIPEPVSFPDRGSKNVPAERYPYLLQYSTISCPYGTKKRVPASPDWGPSHPRIWGLYIQSAPDSFT